MSVIVKGMKMPKNCLHCDFDDSYGICACRNEAPYVCEYSAKQRPSWCPLEEVSSAQPETHEERTETHACDLISRQAAIDALDCISGVEEVLRSLPSAQSEPIRINLNEPIKVKLTDWGKEIYYHQYDRTNQIAGREICKPMFPREDENGYTEFQLWCFIELYGMHMGMTLPNVIEPLEIVFDAPTIEPQRKKGHWIRHPEQRNIFNGKTIECSECHEKYTVRYVEDEWFCRHCGADMREPEDIPMEYFESGGR